MVIFVVENALILSVKPHFLMSETISQLTAIWNRSLKRIKAQLNDDHVYDTFFEGSYIDSVQGDTMLIAVNSGLGVMILTNTYTNLVETCVREETSTNYKAKFITQDAKGSAQIEKEEKKPAFFAQARLDPKYTFDSFVVGQSNREAYQAALMISRNPGGLYNPLLIHSESGLGKTHLLQAVGNEIKAIRPSAKVLYISAADFVDEYMKFVQGYKQDLTLTQYFKNDVDTLLIDDIQFLIGKAKTMEMFFVVFQSLYTQGKQIVITSDQPPSKLEGIDDRLKTRFSNGLVLPIEKPDLTTSKAILRAKIEANNLNVDDFDEDVIEFLASRFSTSVRELEGSLNRLLFYTINLEPTKHITMEVAKKAISSLISAQDDVGTLTEEKIISAVANYYSLTPSQITGKIRTSRIAMARHISMYLIRALLDTPFIKIGQVFGGKDHATVINGVNKVEKALKEDPDMRKAVSELKQRLKAK